MLLALRFILAVIITFTIASIFYTNQVLAKQMAIGAVYTPGQQAGTYFQNFLGLAPAYGAVLVIGLAIGFFIAARLRRILRPLAPVAFPVAGAAVVLAVILLIENTAGAGGVGAIGGARDALGLALQCLAGFIGGLVFAVTEPRH